MPPAVPAERPRDERLGRYLRALGTRNHLALLRTLQVPKTANEIRLPASRRSHTGSPDRPISRQALVRHLRTLVELGLVTARNGARSGRPVTEFVVNHARLFVIAEEVGLLATIRPVAGESETTGRHSLRSGPRVRTLPEGLALVVANGPLAGHAFALRGGGPWTVGRDRALDVALPLDPFVSREHARIVRDGRDLRLEALAAARNGTRINWQPVAAGEARPLRAGDAVGVGRSLLFVRGA